jgi:hypothetical protein
VEQVWRKGKESNLNICFFQAATKGANGAARGYTVVVVTKERRQVRNLKEKK